MYSPTYPLSALAFLMKLAKINGERSLREVGIISMIHTGEIIATTEIVLRSHARRKIKLNDSTAFRCLCIRFIKQTRLLWGSHTYFWLIQVLWSSPFQNWFALLTNMNWYWTLLGSIANYMVGFGSMTTWSLRWSLYVDRAIDFEDVGTLSTLLKRRNRKLVIVSLSGFSLILRDILRSEVKFHHWRSLISLIGSKLHHHARYVVILFIRLQSHKVLDCSLARIFFLLASILPESLVLTWRCDEIYILRVITSTWVLKTPLSQLSFNAFYTFHEQIRRALPSYLTLGPEFLRGSKGNLRVLVLMLQLGELDLIIAALDLLHFARWTRLSQRSRISRVIYFRGSMCVYLGMHMLWGRELSCLLFWDNKVRWVLAFLWDVLAETLVLKLSTLPFLFMKWSWDQGAWKGVEKRQVSLQFDKLNVFPIFLEHLDLWSKTSKQRYCIIVAVSPNL